MVIWSGCQGKTALHRWFCLRNASKHGVSKLPAFVQVQESAAEVARLRSRCAALEAAAAKQQVCCASVQLTAHYEQSCSLCKLVQPEFWCKAC